MVDQLCRALAVQLIYITHHIDELPKSITHVLQLKQGRIQACGPIHRSQL
jgi:molybdate transport system ATP-binding protein